MKKLTKEFIAACEYSQVEMTFKLENLNLNYFKYASIKRDILDSGLYENFSMCYEILYPLILKHREIALEKLKQ